MNEAASSSRPRVSVIVPVRDRRALLRELLDALAVQTFRDFEVVVVDDGSRDGSGTEADADTRNGRPVKVVRLDGRGAVAARLAGIGEARGEILAFTDSDCRPEPQWLAVGVAAIDAGASVVHGETMPARPLKPLERTIWVSVDDGLYATCNLFCRRADYDSVGGFDAAAAQRLRFRAGRRAKGLGFGEDTLLAWRLRRRGRAAFAPEARIVHHVFPFDPVETLSRTWMAGAFPALVREVPELRRTLLTWRAVLGPPSRLLVAVALVAALTGRRPLAVVAAAAWIARRGRGQPLWMLPPQAALDTITTAALVAGSARSRTLVL